MTQTASANDSFVVSRVGGAVVPHFALEQDALGYDAAGRFRVSNGFTEFDSKQIFDNQPLFWDDQGVSGAGTSSTYSKPHARSQLAVSNTTAGKRVRQTFQRFNYQAGKGALWQATGVIGTSGSGITVEIGLHDDDDGLFFQRDDGIMYVVVRSNVSGSPVDTRVAQADWDDPLDGTGPSGITVAWENMQIFGVDFEWFGIGDPQFFIRIDRQTIPVHRVKHANLQPTVYMSTPNLPLRFSIENDGTGAASTMDSNCATVISEGGQQSTGIIRHAESAGTVLDAALTNVFYALLGMRLKSTHLGATIEPLEVGISEYIGNKFYAWHWLFNPTVAGTFTYGDQTNSAVQIARGAVANTITGGTHLGGNVASSIQKGGSIAGDLESELRLGSAIDGTPDELVLAVILRDGDVTGDFEGSLLWRELT